ncbi:MAG: metal ABC transporter ATP-binding protein [Lachnospiraceae bacterium]|nr:metal ABC transporter ATP-binding protein [Lachnospiraceae bacterium]
MRKIKKPCGFHSIKVNHLSVSFKDQEVLSDVNLHIHCGTLTAVIGRNGAGKSTFIRAILGEVPCEGEITFKNTENGAMRELRIGYVPQSINIEKSTPMDVYDLICSFVYKTPVFIKSRKVEGEILSALKEFEADELIHKSIGTLSGGELQRVLLSMAVMAEPDLLLLDEPVSGIDKNGMDLFFKKMKYLKENHDMAVVLISHDLDYVAEYADKVILMDKSVLAEGSPREVYEGEEFKKVFGNTSYGFEPIRNTDTEKEAPFDASYKGGAL